MMLIIVVLPAPLGPSRAKISPFWISRSTFFRAVTRASTSSRVLYTASDARVLFGLGKQGEAGRLTVRWIYSENRHDEGTVRAIAAL